MPVERVSKGFKDLSMTFQVNPVNSDLIAVKNENAIARSIRNLVLTHPGERFFNSNLGSRVHRLLFDSVDDITGALIKDEIVDTIENYEPRVKLKDVIVTPIIDNNEFNVKIIFDVIGIDALPQQLAFALQPTR